MDGDLIVMSQAKIIREKAHISPGGCSTVLEPCKPRKQPKPTTYIGQQMSKSGGLL